MPSAYQILPRLIVHISLAASLPSCIFGFGANGSADSGESSNGSSGGSGDGSGSGSNTTGSTPPCEETKVFEGDECFCPSGEACCMRYMDPKVVCESRPCTWCVDLAFTSECAVTLIEVSFTLVHFSASDLTFSLSRGGNLSDALILADRPGFVQGMSDGSLAEFEMTHPITFVWPDPDAADPHMIEECWPGDGTTVCGDSEISMSCGSLGSCRFHPIDPEPNRFFMSSMHGEWSLCITDSGAYDYTRITRAALTLRDTP